MTYKQTYLLKITKTIQDLDKRKIDASRFRETRKKAEKLHGKHFVPNRFRSAKYRSLSLVFEP